MPGLVPGIHVLAVCEKDVDVRDKPGHDGVTFDQTYFAPSFATGAASGFFF